MKSRVFSSRLKRGGKCPVFAFSSRAAKRRKSSLAGFRNGLAKPLTSYKSLYMKLAYRIDTLLDKRHEPAFLYEGLRKS